MRLFSVQTPEAGSNIPELHTATGVSCREAQLGQPCAAGSRVSVGETAILFSRAIHCPEREVCCNLFLPGVTV